MAATVELVVKAVLGVIGVAMAALSLLVLREVDARSESAMASLQFYHEKTIGDFLVMLLGTAPLVGGFIAYAIGGFLNDALLMNIGRLSGVIASAAVTAVLYRWWKRF